MAFDFRDAFLKLTGNPPFPWQESLYQRFIGEKPGGIPASCNLPTGLGKTSVVAVWLLALAQQPDRVPRRLVYVVNRRTVVDQTTAEVEKYRYRLQNETALTSIQKRLVDLCALKLSEGKNSEPTSPLALSTLRGQFADNREWSADPTRPAVIVGTVDMIGSRLLFSGYGVGFKGRPLHAGFLGQDVLLVHDEAHLEPAFQVLLEMITKEQNQSKEFQKFRVMELSATSRGRKDAFTLTAEDYANETVKNRIGATKNIRLHETVDERNLADDIAELAIRLNGSRRRILVFIRSVDDVMNVRTKLSEQNFAVETLTGTIRGLERDGLADNSCTFMRFLPENNRNPDITPTPGTVFLVCTSAGEVGVNISADHLVCDLTTFESMAQRLGRVNRFGEFSDTTIDIVYPKEFDPADDYDSSRKRTLDLLIELNGDGSPQALGRLDAERRLAAFAPIPTILPTTDILFDTWALSTIHGQLPGRPSVEPYLHGVETLEVAETQFAWREEVSLLSAKIGIDDIEELLDQSRLKPHELLRVATYGKGRAYDQLQKIADRTKADALPVWIVEPDGSLITDKYISDLVAKRGADYVIPLASRTVILPPKAGGLAANGTLDGSEVFVQSRQYDVAGIATAWPLLRFKVSIDSHGISWLEPISQIANLPEGFRVELQSAANRCVELNSALRQIKMPPVRSKFSLQLQPLDGIDGGKSSGDEEYHIFQTTQTRMETRGAPTWPALSIHLDGVRCYATAICRNLKLDDKLSRAIELSGAWHDLGKARPVWQRGAGNETGNMPIAKTIHGRSPENLNRYRHELGSLIDICGCAEFANEFYALTEHQQDVVLHLIAAHHGRGRPHFPDVEAHDIARPSGVVESVVQNVPRRFARLQRAYGRWGLAYLESILRAADILDSQHIESTPLGDPERGQWSIPRMNALRLPSKPNPLPSIRVNFNAANPGQFFACCGLLELADRLWPGAEGYFEAPFFCISCEGTLLELLSILIMDPPTEIRRVESTGLDVKPIIAPLALSFDGGATTAITLDGWMKVQSIKGVPSVIANPPWNFWSGQQTSHSIWLGLREELAGQLKQLQDTDLEDLFNLCSFQKGRFGFDPGPAWNALDVGFSPNEQGLQVASSAAVELLAAVGLQRFRPAMGRERNTFDYLTWDTPLSPSVAAAAMCGELVDLSAVRFRASVVSRGQYAALDYSFPVRTGNSDE